MQKVSPISALVNACMAMAAGEGRGPDAPLSPRRRPGSSMWAYDPTHATTACAGAPRGWAHAHPYTSERTISCRMTRPVGLINSARIDIDRFHRRSHRPAPLPRCPAAPLPRCPAAPLPRCPAPLPRCPAAPLPRLVLVLPHLVRRLEHVHVHHPPRHPLLEGAARRRAGGLGRNAAPWARNRGSRVVSAATVAAPWREANAGVLVPLGNAEGNPGVELLERIRRRSGIHGADEPHAPVGLGGVQERGRRGRVEGPARLEGVRASGCSDTPFAASPSARTS